MSKQSGRPQRPEAPGGMVTKPTPRQGGGLLGQIGDAYSRPLDFTGAQDVNVPGGPLPTVRGTQTGPLPPVRGTDYASLPGLPSPSYSGLQSVSVGKTPLIRERTDLANRYETNLGDFQGRYDDIGRDYALTRPGDFGAERDSVQQAVYDRAMNLLSPQLERQEQRMLTDLANRGLAPTSEAYQDLSGQFADQRQRDLTDLSLASVLAGAQEHQRLADLTSRNRAQAFGEAGTLFDAGGTTYGSLEGLNQAEEAERARVAQRQMALRAAQAREQQAAFQNAMAARGMFAGEGAQRFGEDMSARQQLFNEDMQRGGQQFSQDFATRQLFGNEDARRFQQQAQLRQQQIAEQLMQRGQPARDLASLMGVMPGGLPSMPGFSQYQIASPDYMGLVGSNYAAGQQRQAAGLGGMLGLAGNVLGGPIGGAIGQGIGGMFG